jgi:hypothetical protein
LLIEKEKKDVLSLTLKILKNNNELLREENVFNAKKKLQTFTVYFDSILSIELFKQDEIELSIHYPISNIPNVNHSKKFYYNNKGITNETQNSNCLTLNFQVPKTSEILYDSFLFEKSKAIENFIKFFHNEEDQMTNCAIVLNPNYP